MNLLKLQAFSKINIGLQVLKKRSDGYHEINTIFVRTKLADEITFSESRDFDFACDPGLGIPNSSNLAYKAAILIRDTYKLPALPVKINLKKNVPTGAGLGGGSSDAAATLIGLNSFLNISAPLAELHQLAVTLGSDVPYFINQGSAHARGRGEILDYFDYKLPYFILIVCPDIHISTKWAYDSLNLGTAEKSSVDFKNPILESLNKPEILSVILFNDFEAVVFEHYPEINRLKSKLYENNAIYAQLSGSGSTVFGLFETYNDALSAEKQFKNVRTFISEP